MSGWNGIFFNGFWSCGFDFLPDGTTSALAPSNVFDGGAGSSFFYNVTSAAARYTGKGVFFGNGIGSSGYIYRSFNVNLAAHIGGMAFEALTLPSPGNINTIATFYDSVGAGVQFSIGYNSTGQVGLYSGGGFSVGSLSGQMGSLSAAGVIVPTAYNFLEWSMVIGSSGSVTLNLNGSTILSYSGSTKQTANSFVNRIMIGSNGNDQYVDDMYLLDLTGAAPLNAFLGNGKALTDGPTADSATGGLNLWTPTSPQGTDFGNCANIPANSAQFNASGTVGQRMSFRFPAITASRVIALNTWYSAKEDAAGVRTIVPIYRSNGVDQVGPVPNSLGSSFVYYNQPSTIDPNTGQPWSSGTVAAAGSCEIGLEVNS